MDENITVVFHGFLNLNGKQKLRLVQEINEYFDSTEREPIRAENELNFKNINFDQSKTICKCCGR